MHLPLLEPMNFMPPKFYLVFWSCGALQVLVLSPDGHNWWFFVKSSSSFSTGVACIWSKSEYLAWFCRWYCCCNDLFEGRNVENVFSTISTSSIGLLQNEAWKKFWIVQNCYPARYLNFMRRSSDYSRRAFGKMIAFVDHSFLWV